MRQQVHLSKAAAIARIHVLQALVHKTVSFQRPSQMCKQEQTQMLFVRMENGILVLHRTLLFKAAVSATHVLEMEAHVIHPKSSM